MREGNSYPLRDLVIAAFVIISAIAVPPQLLSVGGATDISSVDPVAGPRAVDFIWSPSQPEIGETVLRLPWSNCTRMRFIFPLKLQAREKSMPTAVFRWLWEMPESRRSRSFKKLCCLLISYGITSTSCPLLRYLL